MAVAFTVIKHHYDDRVKIFKWVLASGETGEIAFIPHLQGDKTFSAIGTFNSSDCKLEGSIDPDDATTFVQLKNLQGDNLLFTAADIESVAPACYAYRPVAGTVTGVTAYLFAR